MYNLNTQKNTIKDIDSVVLNNRTTESVVEGGTMNLRKRITDRMIRETMMELLKNEPLSQITVSKLCEKAEINRSTFYTYYSDINDLYQTMKEQFIEEVIQAAVDDSTITTKNSTGKRISMKVSRFIYDHKDEYIVFYGKDSKSDLTERLVSYYMKLLLSNTNKKHTASDICKLEIYITNLIEGQYRMHYKWISKFPEISPAEYAAIHSAVNENGTLKEIKKLL